MKHPLLKLEPLIWVLFGQGIMIGTMLLTGWILVVGLLIPLGIVDGDALAYERASRLATNPIGRLVLLGIIALPAWKGAHHVRHFFIDMGHAEKDGVIGSACYVIALAISLAGVYAVTLHL